MRPHVLYVISRVTDSKEYDQLIAHWDRDRFDLSFILLNPVPDCGLQRNIRAAGLPCTTMLYRGQADSPRTLLALWRHMRRLRPAIVHTNLHEATLLGLIAARLAGIHGRVYTRHHSTHNHKYHPVKGVWYDRVSNALAVRIIAISEGVREVLVDLERVPPRKVFLMHHGFDLSAPPAPSPQQLQALLAKHDIATDGQRPIVGVISRPFEWKGLDHAIPAFAELLATAPDAQLVLFNWKSTPHIGRYEAMLRALPPRSWRTVEFEPEVTALFQAFDVFVHVPEDRHAEAFGLVYIEALMSGVPCIFTPSGVMHDLRGVQLPTVRTVPFRDTAAIATALRQWIADAPDAEARKAMAARNIALLQDQVGIAIKMDRLYTLYSELIG